ncbi:CD151 antigen-like [Phlebotomus papatasi]|uniref:Tetraspanin n=1 Tax=Phlebotomus papatasi TaxID=29031 RepID=A0A1B0D562_PHLPP|nr:CD151 antigen-like [Phlebotomus papatasi]XP_055703856.1 CD151 antigen-like [Phlebotomus papatasi]XP_055703857.1 CD151 antigen-like [Phlebotomus papatasi]XP_055703858.1 CD151 antigen-like [Phlebotomus papatasi]XP_055703859.1 CD151 antigen-like [Phlebotomus papatasi]XP_055703860.1 CD151 antigen-like [Phlebotomus papatasi]XP_055703862.1 CD151 antigen-like [Phlebotomus papatasi]XP_055703863.1 CD151 antigen-like [Phlebotomus papatasi]XP_055703864.1 CD151 antigen-like [Phlebotomus papatasi]
MRNNQRYQRHKTRDSDCWSINFLKYVLHIFNTIFFMSGIIVAGVAVWTIFWRHKYISLLSTFSYAFGAYAFIVAGILAIAGGIWGCCGIWREQRAMILCYTFILLVTLCLEASAGSIAYLYNTLLDDDLSFSLNETFLTSYAIDQGRTKAIDQMQQEYKCCGAVRFEDWRQSLWISDQNDDLLFPPEDRVVPDSCCITPTNLCGLRDHPSNIYYTGCIYQMSEDLKHHLIILGAMAAGSSMIPIFGMIISCCLYVKLYKFID